MTKNFFLRKQYINRLRYAIFFLFWVSVMNNIYSGNSLQLETIIFFIVMICILNTLYIYIRCHDASFSKYKTITLLILSFIPVLNLIPLIVFRFPRERL